MTTIPTWIFVLLLAFAEVGFILVLAWLMGGVSYTIDSRCSLCGHWKSEHLGGKGGTCPRSKP